ncbi:DUF397 domain-containing protein [Streptomyces sp. NPDC088748]|uniref:DUF397 domain-containing protein n=1 Tax=Streptomyces sp. NPDC088748 TaxID=3365887 RepID=UPI003818015E
MSPNPTRTPTHNRGALPPVLWRKSSFSGGNDNCVEVADFRGTAYAGVALRDSKIKNGSTLLLSPATFTTFVQHVIVEETST